MKTMFFAAIFVAAVPTLSVAQAFGDMDSSGRFGGMPPGTDRYRGSDQGGFAIPLDAPEGLPSITPTSAPQPCSNNAQTFKRGIVTEGVATKCNR